MTALVFLATFSLYLLTLAPSVTVGDSGELIAAAYSVGVAHPPGYPWFVVLAKLFSVVVPAGGIGFRVNLFSAVCGAGAIAWCVSWWRGFCVGPQARWNRWGVLLGAATLVVARTWWQQNVMAEVYALFFLLVVIVFWGLWKMGGRQGSFFLPAALIWMASIHHQSAALIWPAYLLAFAGGLRRQFPRGERPWAAAAGWHLLVGGVMAGVFLALPLRSLANPAVDWGNSETVSNLLHTVLRQQYQVSPDGARGTVEWMGQILTWLNWQGVEMGWPLTLLGLMGLFYFGVRSSEFGVKSVDSAFRAPHPAWGRVMLGLWLSMGLGVVALGNFHLTAFDREVIEVFWIPCNLAVGWGVMMAVGGLGRWGNGRGRWRLAALFLVSVMGVGVLGYVGKVHAESLRHIAEPIGYWHGRNILGVPEPSSWIFVAAEDNDIFPSAYSVLVEGATPDHRVVDDLGCVMTRIYGDDFKWLNKSEQYLRMKKVQEEIVRRGEGAKYYTLAAHLGNVVLEDPVHDGVAVGLLYRVVDVKKGWQGEAPEEQAREKRMKETRGTAAEAWRRSAPVCTATVEEMTGWDVFSRTVAARYAYMRMEHELTWDRREKALRHGREAALLGYDVSWMQNSLGNVLARYGMSEFAKVAYRRVIELEPKRAEPHSNLGGLLLGERRYDEAIVELTAAIRKNPGFVAAYTNLGVAYKNKGESETAKQVWRKGLEFDPDNVPLRLNLERTP